MITDTSILKPRDNKISCVSLRIADLMINIISVINKSRFWFISHNIE